MRNSSVILMSIKKEWLSLIIEGKKVLEVRKNYPYIGKIDNIRHAFYSTHDSDDYSDEYLKMNRKINKYPSVFNVYFYESGEDGERKIIAKTNVNGFSRVDKRTLASGKTLEELMDKNPSLWMNEKDFNKDTVPNGTYLLIKIGPGRIAFTEKLINLYNKEMKTNNEIDDFNSATFALDFRISSCVPFEKLIAYLENNKFIYGWHLNEIQNVNLNLEDFKNTKGEIIKRPPQSYCYVEEMQ